MVVGNLVLDKWHIGVVHRKGSREWLIDDSIVDGNLADTCSKELLLADSDHVEVGT